MSSVAPLITFLGLNRVMRDSVTIYTTEMQGAGIIQEGWNTSAFVAYVSKS